MSWIRAFLAGYASTLVFHQGALWLLNLSGFASRPLYPSAPVPPFGIPAIISLSFWGGVWGILLMLFLKRISARLSAYPAAILFGALAPSLVALALVLPLKGGPFMAGFDPKILAGALIVNGAWGFGARLMLKA